MSPAERAYALLLRAYPARFRTAYGREMMLVFRDQRRVAGASRARFWAELLLDLAQSVALAHADALRERREPDIPTWEGTMRPMAILAVVVGGLEVVNALTEAWAGGIRNGDGYSLAWGLLVALVGVMLVVAGIALLRRTRAAVAWARGAAVSCLALFATMHMAQPRLSIFATMLGIVFPVALLIYLHWRHGRSTPLTA